MDDARQVKRTLPSDQYSTEARAYTEHTRTLADNTEPKAPATHIKCKWCIPGVLRKSKPASPC